MILENTFIAGCYIVKPKMFQDARGSFVKTFQNSVFSKLELETNFMEDFYSFSEKNVIRGMHFQTPPFDHAKLVSCISGKIVDVIVDLRKNSPSYKAHVAVTLEGINPTGVYIPRGCAHGFLSLEDKSCVYYKVSSEHAPSSDAGIRWDSFGYRWPCAKPIMSDRDRSFAHLADFESPFL